MYCALCGRPVDARRHIGAGTWVGIFFTGGLWLLAIPFYSKRCAICHSTAVSPVPDARTGAAVPHGQALDARLEAIEHRLQVTEGELEAATAELERLRVERDFDRKLLGERAGRELGQSGTE